MKKFSGKANTGMLFVVMVIALISSFAFVLVGGNFPSGDPPDSAPVPGTQVVIFNQDPNPGKKNLQLQTFTVKNICEQKIAVDFLLDISGSMAFDGGIKQKNEKSAINAFTARMADNSVIGIQTFSRSTQEKVPLSYYKDVKSQVASTVNSLPADGWTSTRLGFDLAKQKLSAAISQNKFPGYKYFMILITDGVPESSPLILDDAHCEVIVPDATLGKRCFAKIQDPRIPTDLSADIKNLGVEIYSLALTSPHSSDRALQPYLTELLQNVASSPLSSHFYSSDNGQNLKTQLDSVFKDICN